MKNVFGSLFRPLKSRPRLAPFPFTVTVPPVQGGPGLYDVNMRNVPMSIAGDPACRRRSHALTSVPLAQFVALVLANLGSKATPILLLGSFRKDAAVARLGELEPPLA